MRVRVDVDKCQGHARCAALAPEVYELDELGYNVTPLKEVPPEQEDAALCYPWCAPGYQGVGPVCWQNCPDGYTDLGASCYRAGNIISSNNSACPGYDLCGVTFAKGCSVCPPGYNNDGCTCRIDPSFFFKNSYGRGVGTPMQCAAGQESIGAL